MTKLEISATINDVGWAHISFNGKQIHENMREKQIKQNVINKING